MPFSINLRPNRFLRKALTPSTRLQAVLREIFQEASDAAIAAVVDEVLVRLLPQPPQEGNPSGKEEPCAKN